MRKLEYSNLWQGFVKSAGSARELYFLRSLPLREVAVYWPVLVSDPVAMLRHGNE
jgi:hypothetical protein